METAIVTQVVDGGERFAGREWPRRTHFSSHVMQGDRVSIRLRRGHVHINLLNGRAVYRIIEKRPATAVAVAELVYSEGPD